ncbi:hypothetical protein SMICM304S_09918 [Streptomyces microflavus]
MLATGIGDQREEDGRDAGEDQDDAVEPHRQAQRDEQDPDDQGSGAGRGGHRQRHVAELSLRGSHHSAQKSMTTGYFGGALEDIALEACFIDVDHQGGGRHGTGAPCTGGLRTGLLRLGLGLAGRLDSGEVDDAAHGHVPRLHTYILPPEHTVPESDAGTGPVRGTGRCAGRADRDGPGGPEGPRRGSEKTPVKRRRAPERPGWTFRIPIRPVRAAPGPHPAPGVFVKTPVAVARSWRTGAA